MPEVTEHPLTVDVHTHVFNAWDIPFRGYLNSRREYGLFSRIGLGLVLPVMVRCIRGGNPPRPSPNPGLPENRHCWMLRRIFPKGYARWAHILAMHVVDVAARMREAYERTHLFVPLMVDYEYWFASTEDVPIDDQVEELSETIVRPHAGRIHPFVSFDPARQLAFEGRYPNPDGKLETIDSLKLVEDAILHKGFIGVKLYNALGYRPFWNAEVEAERRKIAQHGSRYRFFTGADYDRVLCRLYQFCVEHEVPITTHCHATGIEAFKGASEIFGDPKFWWPVLELYPTLRVNLAHFGWYRKDGEGYGGERSWTREICARLADYPNLYADVAHHDAVTAREKPRFVREYRELLRDHPEAKTRLLFGTDWHVFIRREKHRDMDLEYADVLRQTGGFSEAEIADFLGGNALRFLGLLPGGKNRARLAEFYGRHGITPPEWLVRTEAA